MMFVETLTPAVENRLTAQTKKELHKKVANSKKSYHKGYPDETGYMQSILIDPKHKSKYNKDINICNNSDTEKTILYTALLAYPYIPINQNVRAGISIKDITDFSFVNPFKLLNNPDSDTKEILQERERMLIDLACDTQIDFENKILTTDYKEKIIINAYRNAKRRVEGNPTAEDVKNVLNFKRNNFEKHFDEKISSIDNKFIMDIVQSKTCAPILPKNTEEKTILLYWMDNPDASISDVVKNTGISRGKFETFRLNLPEYSLYNKEYIKNMMFNKKEIVSSIKSYIKETNHDIYECQECSKWSFTMLSLSAHKMHSKDHDNEVKATEISDLIETKEDSKNVQQDTSVSVDDMLNNYVQNKSKKEDVCLTSYLCDSDNALSTISSALNESIDDVLNRFVNSLTELERKELENQITQ